MKYLVLKITKKDKYKYLTYPLIIGIILDIVIVIAVGYYYKANSILVLKMFLACLVGQSFLYYIPLLVFYFNYYKVNKNVTFTVDLEHKHFIYENGKTKIDFKDEDIEKVIFFLSIPLFNNRTIYLYWHIFSYAKIITKKGNLVITCLVCDNLMDFINEDRIERKSFHFSHSRPK